jgi:hypothetical protein
MGAAEDAGGTWLVLVYKLPAKPGGLKTLVQRKLTAAGRLDARYRTMSARGTAGAADAGKAREASSALASYRSALDEYASSVYATASAS